MTYGSKSNCRAESVEIGCVLPRINQCTRFSFLEGKSKSPPLKTCPARLGKFTETDEAEMSAGKNMPTETAECGENCPILRGLNNSQVDGIGRQMAPKQVGGEKTFGTTIPGARLARIYMYRANARRLDEVGGQRSEGGEVGRRGELFQRKLLAPLLK